MARNKKYYAVYWGEEILTHGSSEFCAAKLGLKPNTINRLGSETYKRQIAKYKRNKGDKEPMIAIVIGECDEWGN